MNNNPLSHSKTSFWRIVASFLCCLRKKSPQIHLPPNLQNFEDLEAQHPPLTPENKDGQKSLEISLENSREAPPNQDQSISSPPFENNNFQTISPPLSNPQKQAQNNPLENHNIHPNIQETTQKDVNLPINLLNSQQQISTIPSKNCHSLKEKTASTQQSLIKKDSGLTDETPTNDPKSSLENLNNHPNSTQETQILPQPTSIPPNNKRPLRKKVARPPHLQIHPQEISVHSEKTVFYSARSDLSQENNKGQPKTQDLQPQHDSQSIQEKENVHASAEAGILQRRPKEDLDILKMSNRRLNHKGFNNPSANYCFAHALLQILYGLPEFREKTKRLAGQERSNEILTKLCELFENIETKAQAKIERTKEELIERIKQKNQGVNRIFPSNSQNLP